jgi:Na+-transporting NADH:ubiquinone oxidoreductase subunit C
MAERESVARTLAVAGGVALVCSLLVSSAVYWLRPIQLAYGSIQQNRAILVAAGLATIDDEISDRDIVDRYLEFETRIVDLDTDTFTDADESTAMSYEYRRAMDYSEQSVEIPRDMAIEGLARRPRYMPVYVLRRGRAIERIVLPVYGRGMWSTIHGFVSLSSDLATVAGVRFYEHGETPGIGDRIQNPAWAAQWVGKRAYADDGTLVLGIGAPAGGSPGDRVDAITGATVTVTAVNRFVRYWLGEDGYGPLLAKLRAERE